MELEDMRRLLVCFYVGGGLSVVHNTFLLQRVANTLTNLFDRLGLKTNINRTEVMVFLP